MAKHGLKMLLSQYRQSSNLKKYIQCFLDEFAEVKTAMADTVKYRRLADSYGVMVDDIAYLVGTSRIIYGAVSLGFFGFYSNPAAFPAGDDNDPSVGGILRSDSDKESGDFTRTDAQLKNAIRARIIKTVTNCNIDDILDFCDLVLDTPLDMEVIETNKHMEFIVHQTLSVQQKILMAHMIPDIKPGGVGVTLRDNNGEIALVYSSINYPPDNV